MYCETRLCYRLPSLKLLWLLGLLPLPFRFDQLLAAAVQGIHNWNRNLATKIFRIHIYGYGNLIKGSVPKFQVFHLLKF